MPFCVQCKKDKIQRFANFNDVGKRRGQFCSEHKLVGMVKVGKNKVDIVETELFQHPKFLHIQAHPNGTVYKKADDSFFEICKKSEKHLGRHVSSVKFQGQRQKVFRYRLVQECCTQSLIPEKVDIDHIDNNCSNDAFENLQALTRLEHNQKTHGKDRNQKSATNNQIALIFKDASSSKQYFFQNCSIASDFFGISVCSFRKLRLSSTLKDSFETPSTSEIVGEEWKLHPTGIWVSNMGRYRNKSMIHLGTLLSCGYRQASKGEKHQYVHRLVADCFLDPPRIENYTVNHINFDRTDNRAANLEQASMKEQNSHKNLPNFKKLLAELEAFLDLNRRLPSVHEDQYKLTDRQRKFQKQFKRGDLCPERSECFQKFQDKLECFNLLTKYSSESSS